jgi:hypothetical protein
VPPILLLRPTPVLPLLPTPVLPLLPTPIALSTMPIESSHPAITVPPVDLWTFLFTKTDRKYPDDHGVYVENETITNFLT